MVEDINNLELGNGIEYINRKSFKVNSMAKIIEPGTEEWVKDETGITTPTFHRRIDGSQMYRMQIFTGDGQTTEFQLDPQGTLNEITDVEVNNVSITGYVFDPVNAIITFNIAPEGEIKIIYLLQVDNKEPHTLHLCGTNSYRYTELLDRNENSDTSEIP